MKIKVFVMESCIDCISIKEQIMSDPRFEVFDIGRSVKDLKMFLGLRDTHPAFEEIKKAGQIGIPCFIEENGNVAFDPEEFGIVPENAGSSCGLDRKGC